MEGGDTMPAYIIPNLARAADKHLTGFSNILRKQHYQHVKEVVLSIIEGAGTLADVSRKTGVPSRTLEHFFHESFFNDDILLSHSAAMMEHRTPTRSTRDAFLIMDFTATKTGQKQEWADWLWDEETATPSLFGHEQLLAVEFHPLKKYRKCLGFRRFYHQGVLKQTEYSEEDFEKKPVAASRLLKAVRPRTRAGEVLVDGEFINGFLVNRLQQQQFDWTGRIKKSLLVVYQGAKGCRPQRLELLAEELEQKNKLEWQKVRYRNQNIKAASIKVTVPSLSDREVEVAICRNSQGKLAFLATSRRQRSAGEIVTVYAYRWEIEIFIKDIKQALAFGDCRIRRVGANTRWQILCLAAANVMELIKKTKLELLIKTKTTMYRWFSVSVKRLYRVTRLTLGVTISLIRDLRSGGRELLLALKRNLHLNIAKKFLYTGVNFARV